MDEIRAETLSDMDVELRRPRRETRQSPPGQGGMMQELRIL